MIESDRLLLTHLTYADCEFIHELLNEPAFKQFIGDRGVNSNQDAHDYLKNGPIGSYAEHGFGLYRVAKRKQVTALGICGLVKRDEFEHPDLGFAFLQAHWSNGYAYEASQAVLSFARQQLGLSDIFALVNSDNERSLILLDKFGFCYEKMVLMPGESEEICQYSIKLR